MPYGAASFARTRRQGNVDLPGMLSSAIEFAYVRAASTPKGRLGPLQLE